MTDKPKRPRDANQLAKFIVDLATEEIVEPSKNTMETKSQADFGREGGKIGGIRRAERLTPERRREIAKEASRARWRSDDGN